MGAEPELLRLGIDDPAHYAAWRFEALLEARGVRVTGAVAARHRPLGPPTIPRRATARRRAPAAASRSPASPPPPLAEDLVLINKASQNLHAELMLRRLGRRNGTGSIADGLAVVRAMLERAGVRARGLRLLRRLGHVDLQPRSRRAASSASCAGPPPSPGAPPGARPFPSAASTARSPAASAAPRSNRRLFAKTGTLNATSALSGYMIARSGRTLHLLHLRQRHSRRRRRHRGHGRRLGPDRRAELTNMLPRTRRAVRAIDRTG